MIIYLFLDDKDGHKHPYSVYKLGKDMNSIIPQAMF